MHDCNREVEDSYYCRYSDCSSHGSEMELRLRKGVDLENGVVSPAAAYELQNRNTELETLVSSLKRLLDLSRRREKKILKVLEESGIEHHLEIASDDELEQSIHPEPSYLRGIIDRSSWLVGLLIFQSLSSYILRFNEALLQTHPAIVYFLTMLVGAGGNAGNQATVRAIRGIALGTLSDSTILLIL